MQTAILGKTGLAASVAGLGTGGHSQIGLPRFGEKHAASLVRAAYEGGINFFDSSAAYGTEGALGLGLEGIPRDKYLLSTKFPYRNGDGSIKSPEEFAAGLEASLRALRTDYVDIYHIHGVHPGDYHAVCERYLPLLQKAREQGKIRFPGITEVFARDTSHQMLQRALRDGFFDVVMVGYNLLNPSAAKSVLPLAAEKQVGTLCMFAVRNALSKQEELAAAVRRILEEGQSKALCPDEDLSFLCSEGGAGSVMEAAYRFCRHTPGMHVVLTGTADREHLAENTASINMPPLPAPVLARLEELFGGVDCVSGD